MRKVSRADETSNLNYRTANSDYCLTPRCPNKPENGASHCPECIEKVKNPPTYIRELRSSKTAGAWPSIQDHEEHLKGVEALIKHHTDGIVWHTKQGKTEEAQKHAAAAGALVAALHACREAE
jgi:hypothetical protein